MHDDKLALWGLPVLSALNEAEVVAPDLWRVDAVVAPKERGHQLREDVPDERFCGPLALVSKISYYATEVTTAAVFHVEV